MATNKYFRCPYCNNKYDREKMVAHLEKNHLEELPETFTPLQATFHIVNKKDFKYRRPCRICRNNTEWDENKGRYNFLCDKKSCKDSWVENMKKTMGDKLGSNRPTQNPEGLQKMLNARRISGTYKFQDGGERTYCGSYEKKALEFFDKILNVKSEDIATPGPLLKYKMENDVHLYIPDIYYIPYNLIIEVKDGGNNPNTNQKMSETRKRQMAKERFIIDHTDYNYLRLTDNDFSQLLSIFADLKMNLVEESNKRVIHVNENMMMGAIPMEEKDNIIILNYRKNNVFAEPDFAIADDIKLSNLIIRNQEGVLDKVSTSYLENTDYSIYSVTCDKEKIIEKIKKNIGKEVNYNFIFETIFGHKLFSNDQILFEESAKEIEDFYHNLEEISTTIENYIKGE